MFVCYHQNPAKPKKEIFFTISTVFKISESEAWDWNKKEKSSNHIVSTIIEEDDQIEQVQLYTEVQVEVPINEN